ncbi:MAG: hypothetical protein H8E85_07935 [Candidatus Marinimicrobia bacterium]|nr:hypothetical protein [Candidatus Neomarinimicrobiota bacterium]
MTNDLIFYIALALMFTHQFDAMRCHEWRMIPPLSGMRDSTSQRIFIMTHFPVLVLIFWIFAKGSDSTIYNFQLITDIVLAGHIGKHIVLNSHIKNEFRDTLSQIIILSVSVFASMHLILLLEIISL